MLRKAGKLYGKIASVFAVCGPLAGLRFTNAVLAALPAILRTGNLRPADDAMTGNYRVRLRGRSVVIPCAEVDRANAISEDAPTFAAIRELYGDDVYLRGFRTLGTIRTFVDLGANRGMASLLGAGILGAEIVVGVEVQAAYTVCFDVLADANGLSAAQRHRVVRFAAGVDSEDSVSMSTLCADHGLAEIDFLKCDIEGGENSVFLDGDTGFLDRTRMISMELHPGNGTRTGEIVDLLHQAGFRVALTDADARPAAAATADYLYAARSADALASLPVPSGS